MVEKRLTIDEIKSELAERAGTCDVPDSYAKAAAEWISTLLLRVDAWAEYAAEGGRR